MGQAISNGPSLPPEITEVIFKAFQNDRFEATSVFDGGWARDRPRELYPDLLLLSQVSKAWRETVTPFLFRNVELNLGERHQVDYLQRSLLSRPKLADMIWKVHIVDETPNTGKDPDVMVMKEAIRSICELLGKAVCLRHLVLENIGDDYEEQSLIEMLEVLSNHSNVTCLEVFGYDAPRGTQLPALPQLRHLHLDRSQLFPLNQSSLPSLTSLHLANCLPHPDFFEAIAPQIRSLILHGQSDYYDNALKNFPQLDHFHHITLDHKFLEHPLPAGRSIKPTPPAFSDNPTSIPLVEFDMYWQMSVYNRTIALERVKPIIYCSRAIKKLAMRLWLNEHQKDKDSPEALLEEAKKVLKRKGTVLEVEARYL